MAEARKLDAGSPKAANGDVVLGTAEALPPLPDALTAREPKVSQATAPRPRTSSTAQAVAKKKGGFGRAFLALFLVGLTAFAFAAALTSMVVTGMLDLKSGGLKASLKTFKTFVTQLKS